MKILGICGSLRTNSSNGHLMLAAKKEFKSETWYDFNISELPYFDPDNQFSENIPAKVLELRKLASMADLIFITTPEYAHGMPGILKNALEWIFHQGTEKKSVFVLIGTALGESTKTQFLDILPTMDFTVTNENIVIITGARTKVDSSGNFTCSETSKIFKSFCEQIHLLKEIK